MLCSVRFRCLLQTNQTRIKFKKCCDHSKETQFSHLPSPRVLNENRTLQISVARFIASSMLFRLGGSRLLNSIDFTSAQSVLMNVRIGYAVSQIICLPKTSSIKHFTTFSTTLDKCKFISKIIYIKY